jgi:hypothetical protein
MPDALDPRRGDDAPLDWGRAFAGLALETPPADSRHRFLHALQAHAHQADAPRRDRRGTWAVGLASAAVLALVVVAPMLGWNASAPDSSAPVDRVAADAAPDGAALPPSSALPAMATGADAPLPTDLRRAQRAMPGMERVFAQTAARVDRRGARQATDRLVAGLQLDRAAWAAAAASDAQALAQLRQQSQQLETLVAMARDERVSSSAGALIGRELDAAITQVDAALLRDDLDDAQRLSLWQQRVDALEHLAGLEVTQRWLASQGVQLDAALVSVD